MGPLAECRIKTATGDVQLDRVGTLAVDSAAGRVEVGTVEGRADISTGSGKVRVREIDGPAVVKNSNGDSWIGSVGGDVRVSAANGDVAVDRAGAGVVATTANGDVRIGELARGSASLKTGLGEIEIGIRAGTAARLDVSTSFGRVRNQLEWHRWSTSDGRDAGPACPQRLRRHHRPPGHRRCGMTAIKATGLHKSYGSDARAGRHRPGRRRCPTPGRSACWPAGRSAEAGPTTHAAPGSRG